MAKNRAVVTVSGGLDSAVTLALALEQGRDVIALFIDYGQRCKREKDMWVELVHHYQQQNLPVEGRISQLEMRLSCELTDTTRKMPISDISGAGYVPCRNAILFSIAYAIAESEDCSEVWTGATWTPRTTNDLNQFPDATPEFLKSFELTMLLGSRAGAFGNGITLVSPLSGLSKIEVVENGMELNVPFEKTWTCWNNGKKPCQKCMACRWRIEAFEKAGFQDPALR